MEMITVTAKTVEDAITQASVQLGVSSDRLQYEVVEREAQVCWADFSAPGRRSSVRKK